MESAVHWVTPLAILPGVALLVLSTANRFHQVHTELQRLRDDGHRRTREQVDAAVHRLMRRSVLFRNALVCLYVAIASFSLAALVGGVSVVLWHQSEGILFGLLAVIGIACVVCASVILIREASLSLALIQRYGEEICSGTKRPE